MKKLFVPSLIVIFCLLACSLSFNDQLQTEVRANTETALQENDVTMTVIPVGDALERRFRPLNAESPEGPQIAVLDGDPDTGPSFTLFRYEPNYTGSGKLHTHSHDYQSWLIEGAMKHWDAEGSEETASILRPGSYWHQPGGLLHADNCVAERCTAYVFFDGPIDANFPEDRRSGFFSRPLKKV